MVQLADDPDEERFFVGGASSRQQAIDTALARIQKQDLTGTAWLSPRSRGIEQIAPGQTWTAHGGRSATIDRVGSSYVVAAFVDPLWGKRSQSMPARDFLRDYSKQIPPGSTRR